MVYNFGKFRNNKIVRAAAFRAGDAVKSLGMRDVTSKVVVHGLGEIEVVLVRDPRYDGDSGEKAVLDILGKAGLVASVNELETPTFFLALCRGKLNVDAETKTYVAEWLSDDNARAA